MPELAYSSLKAAMDNLEKKVSRSADAIRAEAKAIDDEAAATARDAESIAALRVDKTSVAETHELAKIMRGLSEAVISHATAAATTARQAQAVRNQNQASHSQINEAMARSTAGPEVYNTNRQWVMPE